MNKLAYILIMFVFCVSCSTSRSKNSEGCNRYSSSKEFKFYSKHLTSAWLLHEVYPDSVEDFINETLSTFLFSFSTPDTSSMNLSEDEIAFQNLQRQRIKQQSESFLQHYEAGDTIWSFNNAPSKPGNLGWEYGLLILKGCNIKYVEPIIMS